MSSVVNIDPETSGFIDENRLTYNIECVPTKGIDGRSSDSPMWVCRILSVSHTESGNPSYQEVFKTSGPTAQAAFDGALRELRSGKVAYSARSGNETIQELRARIAELEAISHGKAIKPKGRKSQDSEPEVEEDIVQEV